jgi:hypothetical protein
MKAITRFSLVGASVLSLTVPAPAASTSKADRTASRPAAAKQNTAPTAAERRTRAPVRSGTDWDFLVGVDRASSPYGHDGY